ncbi:MAG: phosphotransferase [Silicimonas sp.]|nr:phosphotransferase [Silicimonas sp.]
MFRTNGLDEELVFKTTTRSPEAIHWLAPVQAAARASGFVVPKLLPTRSGRIAEQRWTCEAFLPGEPLPSRELPDIAPMLQRFHAAARELPQRPGFLSSQDFLTHSSGGDINLEAVPASIAVEIRAAFRALDPVPMTVIHGDVTSANTLRLTDGRIALLDWDEARRDLPLFDFQTLRSESESEKRACLAWEIACCWQKEPARAAYLAAQL